MARICCSHLSALQCCVVWEVLLQPSSFQLQHHMSCLLEHAQQDCDNLIELRDVSNKLRVEGHFKALWKRLEFPSSLKLFPPVHPAVNVCSCGSGL